MRPPRRARPPATATATVLAAVLVAVLAGCGPSADAPVFVPATPGPSDGTSGRVAPSPTATPSAAADRGPVAALGALLEHRATAFLHHDRDGWLAPVDPEATALRKREAGRYDDARAVPFARWSTALVPGSGESAAGGDRWTYTVATTYTMAGLPREPAVRRDRVGFVRRGDGWRIASLARDGGHPELWELGRVRAVRDGRVTVLGVGHSAQDLQAVLDIAHAAVPRIDDVWDATWARGAVLTLPATAADAGLLAGGGNVDGFAAIATGDFATDARGQVRHWDRVVVNPAAWTKVDAVGRGVVVRHELTHVATGSLGTVPTWAAEGFADYVGWKGTDVPARYVAQELAVRVRRGDVPEDLPTSGAFAGSKADVAYEEAWLANRYVAHHYGQARLVRLYRALADRPGVSASDQDHALRAALGVSRDSFVRSWRAYVEATLA